MKDKMYKHICLNYHTYSILANVMIALAIAGFALLGVLTSVLTVTVLVAWGLVLACIYGVGKLLDQEVDDLDKVAAHIGAGRCKVERNSDSSRNNSSFKSSV